MAPLPNNVSKHNRIQEGWGQGLRARGVDSGGVGPGPEGHRGVDSGGVGPGPEGHRGVDSGGQGFWARGGKGLRARGVDFEGVVLCMGVLRPALFQSLQLAEPFRCIHPEKGADPSHLYWLGRIKQSHMCGWSRCLLSLT